MYTVHLRLIGKLVNSKDKIRVVLLFRRENKVVVSIAKRLKR